MNRSKLNMSFASEAAPALRALLLITVIFGGATLSSRAQDTGNGIDFHGAVNEYEQQLIAQALARTGGNKTYAADLLRLKRTTLLAKLRQQESHPRPARSA